MTLHSQIKRDARRRGNVIRFKSLCGREVIIDLDKNPPTLCYSWSQAAGERYWVETNGGTTLVSKETWGDVKREARG